MRAAFFLMIAGVLGLFAPTQGVAQAEAAQQMSLSTEQARALAIQSVRTGNFPVADAISSALLAQDPDDSDMLFVRALLARQVGDLEAAEEAAAAAYRTSENPVVQFETAILVADLLAREEKYLRSEFWLRRADQAAQSPQQERLAANLFRRVQQLNPLSIQLRFTARPSNNVNNGAETLEIEIGGLPFRLNDSGQQLGGYEASTGVSLSYRLSESETQRTEFLGELFYRKIWLDSDAKEDAPEAEGSDYDYGVVIVGLRHQRLIWPETGPSEFTGLIGQSWYGGDELARWLELSARQTVQLGERSLLNFGTRIRTERRLDDEINDSDQLALSVDYRRAVESGGSYGLGATIRNVWSDSATVDRFSTEVRADRAFGRIGAIAPRIRLSLENQNYHEFTSTIDGRQDRSITLDLSARFPDTRFYGFIPEASIRARQTESNVDIYDRNEISFGITAVSRF